MDKSETQNLDPTPRGRELLEFIEKNLYTAAISDALDEAGFRSQAMREYIRPVYACRPFAGWARTIACADVYHIPADPYALAIEALAPASLNFTGTVLPSLKSELPSLLIGCRKPDQA